MSDKEHIAFIKSVENALIEKIVFNTLSHTSKENSLTYDKKEVLKIENDFVPNSDIHKPFS